MKRLITYGIWLMCIICFTLSCNTTEENAIPSLKETYSRLDKKPFGTYIAYHQLENMFARNTIRDKKQPFNKTWNDISDTNSLYVCIAPGLYVNDAEVKAMLGYVYSGNNLFIAANYIDEALLDEISCKINYAPRPVFNMLDSLRITDTRLEDSIFSYYYQPFKNSFLKYDTSFTRVLGVNENNKPNFVVYFHGKGKLFLHCEPKTFSNYFLLKNDNYKYLQDAFAYTANYPDHLYWDDYYRKLLTRRSKGRTDDEKNNFSSFSELMKHPPLAAAFWLSLLLLSLYILFGGKRRQRVIEKIKPNENTTVTFTETIGRLYLQKKDNKNIAEKMTTYFNEHVRNHYFLNTNVINDEFITTLSRKSGVDRNKVESLYRAIQHAHSNAVVDDYQLLSLNQQIQNFYHKV